MRANGNGTRPPHEIQAEIAKTRGEMDRTLSAIENRLTPGQLVDQGIDYLKNSGAREYLTNLGGSVKYNPMPVALTAVGIAWLIAMQNRPVQYRFIETGAAQDTGPGAMDTAREKMGEGVDAAREKMNQAGQRVSEMRDNVSNRVSSLAQSARERVSSMSNTARSQAERARNTWDTTLREHPLVIGAVGLALGAVVAALAPRTRREDEMMGEARDRLLDQAKEAGTEKLEQARQVAGAAMDAGKQEAKKQQGMTETPSTPSAERPAKGDSSSNPPSFTMSTPLDNGPRNPS